MTDEDYIKQTLGADPDAAMPQDVLDAMEKCVKLREDRDELKRQQKILDNDFQDAQATVLAWLESSPIDSLKAHGGNFYLIRELSFASPQGTDATVERIMESDNDKLKQLLGINHMKMKGWLKNHLEDPDTGQWVVDKNMIPKEIRDVVLISEFYKLGIRKA